MKHMLYYGDGDITSLEAVFKMLNPYIAPATQYAVLRGNEKFHCPECSRISTHNKNYVTAAGTMQHYMRCTDPKCAKVFKINNKTYQDWLKYKIMNRIK